MQTKPSFQKTFTGSSWQEGNSSSKPSYLQKTEDQKDSYEVQQLKAKMSQLELENQKLKESNLQSMKNQVSNDDRNWLKPMPSAPQRGLAPQNMGQIDRPITASTQNAKIREAQDELKRE